MGEERVLVDLSRWEDELASYVSNDFEKMYEMWVQDQFQKLPKHVQQRFFNSVDQWLIYTYTFLQGTQMQQDAYDRLLQIGRTYDETINTIEDLSQLSIEKQTYLANQHVAKNRLYSFVQGGMAGSGGWFLLGVDVPLMVGLNLRTIQLIGTSFGYNMHNPIEMLLALKVFHAGALPKRLRYEAWQELKENVNEYDSFMGEHEELTNPTWAEQPLKSIFKTLAIVLSRRKMIQGLPIVSVGIGAAVNYKTAKDVSEFATRFYQYRSIQSSNK
ncbi:EcsC family protein [Alkalibacillus sp. S2W]|uniref:EcsC family protein n=1 Tax=Alkalibacillus sp. S2W TaxID=3386553 RepID=UPI00398CFC1F